MNFEDNAERYDVFPDVVEQPVVIREGDYNLILELSKKHVVKVPIEPSYDLHEEYRNHLAVYRANIPAAEPLGIFRFFPASYGGEYGVGLIMKKLRGVRGDQTHGKTLQKAKTLLEEVLEKCRDLGFEPFDTGLHNCIWDARKEKLYLIDFIGWRRRN